MRTARPSFTGCTFRQAKEMVRHTGIRFEEAANEIVKDLTAEDLGSIIAEAVYRYGNLGDRGCEG
jgi:hypothetical protein